MAIDVLVAFDAATIIQRHGKSSDPNRPVGVDHDLIHMLTDQGRVEKENGIAQLVFRAQVNDTIRWREATLGPEYSAILNGLVISDANQRTLISPPEPMLSKPHVPMPNGQDPARPAIQVIQDYFWNTVVLGSGEVTYNMKFLLFDRAGHLQGYYWWDPGIKIAS